MAIDLDRERVACVFERGGGKLHEAHPDFRDEWDGAVEHWHEGVPEYASELRHLTGARTAILDCLFGFPAPPLGWKQVASYSSSGEASCWWCGDGTGNEEEQPGCPLCEGDGQVYLGDGWCEVVYVPVGSR